MKIRAAVEAAKESGILILARTDCRPTQGIDEAVARIEMYVEEGADILFLDSPADEAEIRRAVAAAAGRPSFVVLSPGAPRATPSQKQAAELGFKIGTYPDRHAVAGDRRHEGGPRRPARRRGGSGERAAAAGAAHDPGLCRLRRPGQAVRRRPRPARLTRSATSRLPRGASRASARCAAGGRRRRGAPMSCTPIGRPSASSSGSVTAGTPR